MFSRVSRCSVSSSDVCGGQLLEGRSDVFIAAIYQLPAGDVIGYLLCLSKLSGQGPLPCRHNLEGEHVLVPDLGRVVLGQVLRHGVPLIICPDLLLVTVNSRMRGKSRLVPSSCPAKQISGGQREEGLGVVHHVQ